MNLGEILKAYLHQEVVRALQVTLRVSVWQGSIHVKLKGLLPCPRSPVYVTATEVGGGGGGTCRGEASDQVQPLRRHSLAEARTAGLWILSFPGLSSPQRFISALTLDHFSFPIFISLIAFHPSYPCPPFRLLLVLSRSTDHVPMLSPRGG